MSARFREFLKTAVEAACPFSVAVGGCASVFLCRVCIYGCVLPFWNRTFMLLKDQFKEMSKQQLQGPVFHSSLSIVDSDDASFCLYLGQPTWALGRIFVFFF